MFCSPVRTWSLAQPLISVGMPYVLDYWMSNAMQCISGKHPLCSVHLLYTHGACGLLGKTGTIQVITTVGRITKQRAQGRGSLEQWGARLT